MKEREPVHLLMRFSDELTGVGDTIAAHDAIINRRGSVWIGKMGKTLGRPHVDRINKQCNESIPTYLYLVKKSREGYTLYQGTVLEVCRRLPLKETQDVPKYYESKKLMNYMNFWAKLSEIKPVQITVLDNLLISSTQMSASYSLRRSMAALFVVREGQGLRGA